MMDNYSQAIITMLAVINPAISGIILLELTKDRSKKEKVVAASKAMLQILGILLLVTFIGRRILETFGISHEVFQIVGGIVIAYIGFTMLTGRIKSNIIKNNHKKLNLAPLIMFAASPGTIATLITIAVAEEYFFPKIAIIAVFASMLITWITILLMIRFRSQKESTRHIIATQFMGLILIAMGLQFTLEGFKAFMAF